MKQQLIELIKGIVKTGNFKLASGKSSKYYIDLRTVTLTCYGATLIGKLMSDLVRDWKFDAVGGLTMGADPVVMSMVLHGGWNGFLVRKQAKKYGNGKLIEGSLVAGQRVLIVDDVATSGGSLIKAIRAVTDFGCSVVGVACVLDRMAGAEKAVSPIPFLSLINLTDLGLSEEN